MSCIFANSKKYYCQNRLCTLLKDFRDKKTFNSLLLQILNNPLFFALIQMKNKKPLFHELIE